MVSGVGTPPLRMTSLRPFSECTPVTYSGSRLVGVVGTRDEWVHPSQSDTLTTGWGGRSVTPGFLPLGVEGWCRTFT